MKWLGSIALALVVLTHEAPARADELRANSIAITSFCLALGTVPGALYYFGEPAGRPFWIFHAGLAPSIPRAVMRDWLGTTIFSAVRIGSILLAERRRTADTVDFGYGFLIPFVAAVADIATTPSGGRDKSPDPKTAPGPTVLLNIRRDAIVVEVALLE